MTEKDRSRQSYPASGATMSLAMSGRQNIYRKRVAFSMSLAASGMAQKFFPTLGIMSTR